MSKSNEMRRLIDDFKKFIIKENQYLGSCIEVGDDNSYNILMIYFQMRLKWRIMLETQIMTILDKVKKSVETNFLKIYTFLL